jgi:hypothetical protein
MGLMDGDNKYIAKQIAAKNATNINMSGTDTTTIGVAIGNAASAAATADGKAVAAQGTADAANARTGSDINVSSADTTKIANKLYGTKISLRESSSTKGSTGSITEMIDSLDGTNIYQNASSQNKNLNTAISDAQANAISTADSNAKALTGSTFNRSSSETEKIATTLTNFDTFKTNTTDNFYGTKIPLRKASETGNTGSIAEKVDDIQLNFDKSKYSYRCLKDIMFGNGFDIYNIDTARPFAFKENSRIVLLKKSVSQPPFWFIKVPTYNDINTMISKIGYNDLSSGTTYFISFTIAKAGSTGVIDTNNEWKFELRISYTDVNSLTVIFRAQNLRQDDYPWKDGTFTYTCNKFETNEGKYCMRKMPFSKWEQSDETVDVYDRVYVSYSGPTPGILESFYGCFQFINYIYLGEPCQQIGG